MTAETNRKEILEEWEKLQVIVQLAEKELYDKNVQTVKAFDPNARFRTTIKNTRSIYRLH